MPDYSKGKIYKIVADTDEEYKPYVGSTIEELSRRMAGHRGNYKGWKKGGTNCSSFDLFERFGIENCHIVLLEEYSCDSKMKLLMKEREWFDKIKNCNKYKPFISKEELVEYMKEYREEHKEELVEYMKEYYDANKEIIAEKKKEYSQKNKNQIKERRKIYYEANKETINEKKKEYNQKNKNQIKEKAKQKFECVCGAIICIYEKPRHERSLKHQDYLSLFKA
jgi:hypothetical protein